MGQIELFKIFVSLGIPGLALGIFYILFKTFRWDFPKVPRMWVGPIIVLFMLLTTSIVLYALKIYSNTNNIVIYTGKVIDKYDKEPLVKVSVKYSSNGIETTTKTDFNGNYFLKIDHTIFDYHGTATFSTQGYKTKKLNLELNSSNKNIPNITLDKYVNNNTQPKTSSILPNINKSLTIKSNIFSKTASPQLWFQEAKHYNLSENDIGELDDEDFFALNRTYSSSKYLKQLFLGKGWRHQFHSKISIEESSLKNIVFWDRTGNKVNFQLANSVINFSSKLQEKSPQLKIDSSLEKVFREEDKSDESYFLSNIKGLVYFGIRMDIAQLTFERENIKIKLSNNERYVFNRKGRLIEIDKNKYPKILLRYDPIYPDRLVRVLTVDGKKYIHFTYNNIGLIEKVDLYDGTSYKYKYNNLNLLINVLENNNILAEYRYDDEGRISYIDDKNKKPLKIYYNDVGWRTKESRANKYKKWKFIDLDEYSKVITKVNGEESTKNYIFNNEKKTLSVIKNGEETIYKLSQCGCLPLEVTSPYMNKKYSYNKKGQLTKIITNKTITEVKYHEIHDKITLVKVTTSDNKELISKRLFKYNNKGDLISANTEKGLHITLSYDEKNQISKMTQKDGLSKENKVLKFEYNHMGKPTKIILLGIGEINVTYDDNGEITSVDSESGHKMALIVTKSFQSLLTALKYSDLSIDTRFKQIKASI